MRWWNNSIRHTNTGLRRFPGFTSVSALVLLLYIASIGQVQLCRMREALQIAHQMRSYEAYTYCKAQAVYFAKQALRNQQTGIQEAEIEGCRVELQLADDSAVLLIEVNGSHSESVVSYDRQQDVFSE